MTSLFWIAVALCAAVGLWRIGLAIGHGIHWLTELFLLYRDGIRQVREEHDE